MTAAHRRLRTALALTLGSTLLSACFLSRSKGEELAARTEEHERRLTELEAGIEVEREALATDITRSTAKLAELEDVLDRATKVVTRNSADLGLEVQALREQLGTLEGQIAELRMGSESTNRQATERHSELERQVRVLAERSGVDVTLSPSEIPADGDEHYLAAERHFRNGDHSKARALFREYINRYPTARRADNAQYYVGKSYMGQERPATALGEFRKVLSQYPRGDAVDDTLFDMAEAFWQLHSCSDARTTLEALIRSHRNSPFVGRARTKLREIERAPPEYCTG